MALKRKNQKILILLCLLLVSGFLLSGCSLPGQKKTEPVAEADTAVNVDKLKNENQAAVTASQSNVIKKVRAVDESDHISGGIKAPVQIIVYSDFECPFCVEFKDTLDQVVKNFSDKVVIAFRNYPLRSHPLALSAALASECAADQGKFWEMHDKLFVANKDGKLGDEQFNTAAEDLKLDIVKFRQCYDTQKYLSKIQTQVVEAMNSGVIGTPGVFVNGESLPGAYPYEDFKSNDGKINEGLKSIIERHLKNGI